MEGPLADLVLLGLLTVFFGIQQRSRPQLYIRFWFAGWFLVFLSFLLGRMHPVASGLHRAHDLLRVDTLLLAGVSFLLSFLVRQGRGLRSLLLGVVLAAPACLLLWLTQSGIASYNSVTAAVVALQAVYVAVAVDALPAAWRIRRIAFAAFSVVCGVMMLLANSVGRGDDLQQFMLGQVYVLCALLYAGTGRRFSVGWIAGTAGFVCWGAFYPLSNLLPPDSSALTVLYALWNLPKYAVAFALTLRIFSGIRSELKSLANLYRDLYEDFRLVYENHPLPMWIVDAATERFLSVNAAACASYGYTHEQFLDMQVEQLLAEPDAPSENATPCMTHRLMNGSVIAVELTQHDIVFQGHKARFVLAVDVTEREKLNQQLFHRAQHDTLTGLPNRALLDDRLTQCLLRSTREEKRAVLFTMDVDRFKLINDTHGHLTGDECLKAIAGRLRSRIRSVDTIARTGGEEFTAIIGGLHNVEDAEKIAAMFLRLFDTPLSLPGQDLKLSLSIGGAIFPDDAEDAETLRRKSDQALYHAKRFGRNRFAFASREVCAAFDDAIAIELALRDALRNDGFELHFQPVYSNEGRATHFETLLRMKADNTDVYLPGVFIPVAEECGLILQIGNWVIEQACRQLVAWRQLGDDAISIAINIPGRQLVQKNFASGLLETLADHGLPASAIELELTEATLMLEPALVREVVTELAAAGIVFSIDDFGTGYSSLARIADLPIARLKIDRSFITQLDTTERTEGIVTAIIHMAQTLGIAVVAEGVESDAQLNRLLRHGCDLFQGYYLAQPLAAAQLTEMLRERDVLLCAHPNFSRTRVAVSKRVRSATQLPALVGGNEGAA